MNDHPERPEDDPKAPAPFVPDEADAPRDPDTGAISIDEPDVAEPGEEPDVDDTPPDDPERAER